MHLYKFGIVCHLVPIQTTNVASIWTILLTLLSLISSLCCCYKGFLFIFWFDTSPHCGCLFHSLCNVCQPFLVPSVFSLLLQYLKICGTNSALWASIGVIFSSHKKVPTYAIVTWYVSFLQLQSSNRTIILLETQWSKNCLWLVFTIHELTFVCTHSKYISTHLVSPCLILLNSM